VLLAHYAVIRARAAIEGPSEGALGTLDRLAKIYMAPDAAFAALATCARYRRRIRRGTLVDDCARRIAVDDGGALPLDAHAAIIT
jgi:hypothetical protein